MDQDDFALLLTCCSNRLTHRLKLPEMLGEFRFRFCLSTNGKLRRGFVTVLGVGQHWSYLRWY